MYYPAITTAALFTAIIIRDVITRNTSDISSHAFLGLISILAMIVLSMYKADFVAWGLLVLPMFIILLSYVLTYFNSPIMKSSAAAAASTGMSKSTTESKAAAEKSILTGQTVQLPLNNMGVGISPSTVTPASANCNVHS